jgi:hypothetical protein
VNRAQTARFANINDEHGIESWTERRGGDVLIMLDDGTAGEIHTDGTVTWQDDPDALAAARGQRPHHDNEGHEIHDA